MFKKILLACSLLAGHAQADEWLETINEAGGKILFLQVKCPDAEGKLVIATTPSGNTVNGCWYYFSDMVHVVWTDEPMRGKTSAFEPKTLVYRKQGYQEHGNEVVSPYKRQLGGS